MTLPPNSNHPSPETISLIAEGNLSRRELAPLMEHIAECAACRSELHNASLAAEAEDVPPDGLRVNYHLVIEIEGGKRPACVAELIALHYR